MPCSPAGGGFKVNNRRGYFSQHINQTMTCVPRGAVRSSLWAGLIPNYVISNLVIGCDTTSSSGNPQTAGC